MMFQYEFMKNALIAILLITPLFGLLGTMIVNNKMAFFSDALGHSAIPGIALGVILGMTDTTLSMIIFGILFALLLNWIKYRGKAGAETVISVFASCGLAIGLAVLSVGGNFSKYNSLLIGDILSITRTELAGLLIAFVLTVIFWLFCFNRLHFVSINPSLAQSKGVPVRLYDNLFVVLMAIIVMLSIRWVGLLIINALLILPAAAALRQNKMGIGCDAAPLKRADLRQRREREGRHTRCGMPPNDDNTAASICPFHGDVFLGIRGFTLH